MKNRYFELEERIIHLENQVWLLQNPQKFFIGDKVKFLHDTKEQTGIVVSAEVIDFGYSCRIIHKKWYYKAIIDRNIIPFNDNDHPEKIIE